jgi:streptomycin 6-kinase
VSALQIPHNLKQAAGGESGAERSQWMAGLPRIVEELAVRWSLRIGDPYEPGGQCSWVAPAWDAGGELLALKVGWRHSESTHEADAYRVWDGAGAVRLHEEYTAGETCALLLERCDPGTPLAAGMTETEQDLVLTGLLARLWRELPEPHPFRPLQGMCDDWAAAFESRLATAAARIDRALAREAAALFRGLPSSASGQVLLCTDLHAENVLAARREPWLVIDPKPYVGDPCYDVLQHMLNCRARLSTEPAALAQRLAGLADLDAGRVKRWLFARCMLEAIDRPWLYDVATLLAP